eukprot:GEMP01015696.1.p1 GENE.GEMP01015696.1~~GEMP01015696.1.p1  ORF type:complete len:394 (+),score=67.49 GEMP01015696.1:490-1671(+)
MQNDLPPLLLQDIPIVNHLEDGNRDGDTPSISVSRSTVDNITKSFADDNAFARLFNQLEQRSYGKLFIMNFASIPFFKWHVSKTRIKPFSNTTERSRFFQQDLKLSAWNAFRRKMHSAKHIVLDTFKSVYKPPKFFLEKLMKDVLNVGAKKLKADLEQLVASFVPGSDALEISENAVKSAGLATKLWMIPVPLPVTWGAGVQKKKAQKVKIARNADGTFNVNYSFLRGWDAHVSMAVGFAANLMVSMSGVVVVRPYKKSCEWNFVQGDLNVTEAAEYLESFANGTLGEHYEKYFSSGLHTVVRGGDVLFDVGNNPRNIVIDDMLRLPGIFSNVGIIRAEATQLKRSITGKLEPTAPSSVKWSIEPPTVFPAGRWIHGANTERSGRFAGNISRR